MSTDSLRTNAYCVTVRWAIDANYGQKQCQQQWAINGNICSCVVLLLLFLLLLLQLLLQVLLLLSLSLWWRWQAQWNSSQLQVKVKHESHTHTYTRAQQFRSYLAFRGRLPGEGVTVGGETGYRNMETGQRANSRRRWSLYAHRFRVNCYLQALWQCACVWVSHCMCVSVGY